MKEEEQKDISKRHAMFRVNAQFVHRTTKRLHSKFHSYLNHFSDKRIKSKEKAKGQTIEGIEVIED